MKMRIECEITDPGVMGAVIALLGQQRPCDLTVPMVDAAGATLSSVPKSNGGGAAGCPVGVQSAFLDIVNHGRRDRFETEKKLNRLLQAELKKRKGLKR
jgi:hypothetical protein